MTEALLRELARTTDENGVRLAVFLIPLGIQVEPERLESFLDEHALDREPVVVDAPQQRVTSWGARQGAPVIDLLPVFADTHALTGGPDALPGARRTLGELEAELRSRLKK